MKILLSIILFIISTIVFIPQSNILFTLQKNMQKEKIYLNYYKLTQHPFNLTLEKNTIIYDKIKIANISNISTLIGLFYNKIDISNVSISFNNLKIDKIILTNNILSPFIINIKAISKFANISGYIDLKNKKIILHFAKLKNKNLQKLLQHNKQGYFYEESF